MYTITILILAIIAASNGVPIVPTEDNLFVFAPIEHGSQLPEHGIEVSAHNLPQEARSDDHVLNKKIVAIPITKIGPDTQILANGAGHAVVAKMVEHSNENSDDMETAETMVFRPLFAYRKQQAQRRRVYVPVTYQQGSRPYYPTNQNYNRRYYTVYYRNAQFPAIA